MHVVSTNFAKTLVCKREYDVTNSVYSVTTTTSNVGLRHCSILEFGRGASNQAIAQGITRPLQHATAPATLAPKTAEKIKCQITKSRLLRPVATAGQSCPDFITPRKICFKHIIKTK